MPPVKRASSSKQPPKGPPATTPIAAAVRSVAVLVLCVVLLLALAAGYYIYRLSTVEGVINVTAAVAGRRQHPGDARVDDKARVNSRYTFAGGRYGVLRPNEELVREAVLNPQLDAPAGPRWEDAEEKDAVVAAARRTTPPFRRYVVENTRLGQRYMLKLSFLGSPAVGYTVSQFHVRQSTLSAAAAAAAAHGDAEAAFAFSPTDTEVVTVVMHSRFHGQFADDQVIVQDAADLTPGGGGGGADPFVAVIEIKPFVLAYATDPRDFAVLQYNLKLAPLTGNLLPDMGLPLAICAILVVVGLGCGVLYPALHSMLVRSLEHKGDDDAEYDD